MRDTHRFCLAAELATPLFREWLKTTGRGKAGSSWKSSRYEKIPKKKSPAALISEWLKTRGGRLERGGGS